MADNSKPIDRELQDLLDKSDTGSVTFVAGKVFDTPLDMLEKLLAKVAAGELEVVDIPSIDTN